MLAALIDAATLDPRLFAELKYHNERALSRNPLDALNLAIYQVALPADAKIAPMLKQLPVRRELFELAELYKKCLDEYFRKPNGAFWFWIGGLATITVPFMFFAPWQVDDVSTANTWGWVFVVSAIVAFIIGGVQYSSGNSIFDPYNEMAAKLGLERSRRSTSRT